MAEIDEAEAAEVVVLVVEAAEVIGMKASTFQCMGLLRQSSIADC